MNTIDNIIRKYIVDFVTANNNETTKPYIVENSIPIIWFGNLNAYLNSKERIVTVGLNPSNNEFPIDKSVKRFEAINLSSEITDKTIEELKATLNLYFDTKPYKWFCSCEKVLNIFNASYYSSKKDMKNKAVHIDIYSAIATNPTWGHLGKQIKSQIERTDLFIVLLQFLDPDIILVSTNKTIFNKIFVDNKDVGFRFQLSGERYDPTVKRFYVRKYNNGKQQLYWITNNRGTAFGPSEKFIRTSVDELSIEPSL